MCGGLIDHHQVQEKQFCETAELIQGLFAAKMSRPCYHFLSQLSALLLLSCQRTARVILQRANSAHKDDLKNNTKQIVGMLKRVQEPVWVRRWSCVGRSLLTRESRQINIGDFSLAFSFDSTVGRTTTAVLFLCHLSWPIVVLR